ncbi:uncharacterized protein E0L32_009486 [Thyridium curvatum]|uniref:RNA polymerase II transcription factor B subunit 3 n=1 Tax=Thyridium curvatum TaxID=1093900 RepID=A0A507ARZ4_9PEZI|nr:uncharacterized protein E0L32_009486 [Thyridium curvatum]TPX09294.1 hypothetical protein E0L32_009486 [Thyridium curvatum]
MSRKAAPIGSRPAAAGATAVPTLGGSDMDVCPVCKTMRYLNKDMVFLISPACYHPMCSNCVNRLFAAPNQCPYAGCGRTLRRKEFREAFFGDLQVEREVDVRKRVARVFNRVEDDFESLDAYNEYLERVEQLTMDLVCRGDEPRRAAAEAELKQWEATHRAEIERNRRKGERADEVTRSRLAAEKEAARQRRLEAARQDEEDRLAREREREEDLDTLAAAPEGTAGRIMLKKRGQHRRESLVAAEEAALRRAAAGGGLSIRGLKENRRKGGAGAGGGADGPYDPFGGTDLAPTRYVLQDGYKNPFLDRARDHYSHTSGGYSVKEYYARAMFDAFAGLGVFIEDDKETGQGTTAASVATLGASMAAGSESRPINMEVDDVFG